MLEPPLPPDEAARLRALRDLGLLFTPAEERFDRITRAAARLLRTPVALVSLVGSRVQWFKSRQGVKAGETSPTISFCAHAILGDDTLVVRDARADDRFHDNPLVTGEPFIRFYAGHPLRAPDGSNVGTLCVIDTRPRRPRPAVLEALRDLAAIAEDELRVQALSEEQRALIAERDELRRRSVLDSLTRAWNREAILEVLARELARAERDGLALSLIMADVDRFKEVNDSFGHPMGDEVLLGVARIIRGALRRYDAIGRYGGEEFLIVPPNWEGAAAHAIAERMRCRVEAERWEVPVGRVRTTLSLGIATLGGESRQSMEEFSEAADKALYRAKAAGRNRTIAAP
jgi:diguanylate cyclase (GGDEF)-like protein